MPLDIVVRCGGAGLAPWFLHALPQRLERGHLDYFSLLPARVND